MTPYDHLARIGYDERDIVPPSLVTSPPKPSFWTRPLATIDVTPWHLVFGTGIIGALWLVGNAIEDIWAHRYDRRASSLTLREGDWIDDRNKTWHPPKRASGTK